MPLAKLHLKASNLPDKDVSLRPSDTSDAFYEVYFGDLQVYKSEVSTDNENPEWKMAEFELPRHAFNRAIKVIIWDHDTMTANDLIAEVEIKYPCVEAVYKLTECKEASLHVLNSDELNAEEEEQCIQECQSIDNYVEMATQFEVVQLGPCFMEPSAFEGE